MVLQNSVRCCWNHRILWRACFCLEGRTTTGVQEEEVCGAGSWSNVRVQKSPCPVGPGINTGTPCATCTQHPINPGLYMYM